MNTNYKLKSNQDWQQEITNLTNQEKYTQAIDLCEQAINNNPENKRYYWYLGVILLLQGQEEEAQTTWLLGMADGEPEEVELWTKELTQLLIEEVNNRATAEDYLMSWVIRQHIREIVPIDINNLLHLLDLSITLEKYSSELLVEYEIIDWLRNGDNPTIAQVDRNLLLHILKKLMCHDPIDRLSIEFASVAINYTQKLPTLIEMLIPPIYQISYSFGELKVAKQYAEILLNILPEHKEVLRTVSQFSSEYGDSLSALKYAEKSYAMSQTLLEKIIDYHLICKAQIELRGCDELVIKSIEHQEDLLKAIAEEKPENLSHRAIRLYNSCFFFPYARDNLEKNLKIRHQISQLAQINLENNEKFNELRQKYAKKRISSLPKTLKIGYLSHCFRRHSVGWLARWLFTHHDRAKFEIYGYLMAAEKREDPLQEWYVSKFTKAKLYGLDNKEIAEDIYEDEIDILIDLDSNTLTNACSIVAMKPAPIQATWLGWDASEIPTVDYFIADPYVLPENAQDYYSEKIWRLPQTYIAIDGFEANLPNLRRDNLGIPSNAVVYFTAQRGYKYNPDTAKLQMQILKEVPNSYFLYKQFDKSEVLQELLKDIARSEGVSEDRLIPIPQVRLEEIHRANLAIADVVLDTYPYNGATTTLETLWMCIPIVTKVGQQFAARNSYTMMMNAGITEGIAWSDEEYVDWGIRLGRDENLRKQVSWKLRQSKRTAPLWNAKQFTREMENAYKQMWQIYIEGGS